MKHKRISRKLLSALLAFAMLLAFAAEGAGYVYASELQENATPVAEQLQEADETGESAQEADTQEESEVPEPQETAEQAEPAEQSEEATAEEKVPAPEEAEQPETEEDSAEAKEQEEIADVSEEPEEVDSETEEADAGAIEDTLLRAMAPVLRAPENNLTNAFYVYFAIPNSWASYDYNKVYVNVRKGNSGAGKDMWAQKAGPTMVKKSTLAFLQKFLATPVRMSLGVAWLPCSSRHIRIRLGECRTRSLT